MNQTRTTTPDIIITADRESDRLWTDLIESKRRYEHALSAYIDHHVGTEGTK